jgi:hypothetical protein
VEAVIQMMEWQIRVRDQLYPIIADNQIAAMEQKIRKALARAPGRWFTRWHLSRIVNARRTGTPTFEKALEGLRSNAEVEHRSEPHRFNKTVNRWYRSVGDGVTE